VTNGFGRSKAIYARDELLNLLAWHHCVIGSLGHRDIEKAIAQWRNGSITQFFQERFRLLQVFRVKPFREPVVDFRQQLVIFLLLALLLPETGKAC